LNAFTDARIAALKAGLQLTPDQVKNWPPFELALREMAQLRIERMQSHDAGQQQDQAPATPFDRLARRADSLSKTGAALKHIADACTPLYQSLSDSQKHRFGKLARMLRPHHHHMHARGENHGSGWREGQGYGSDGDQNGNWRGFQNHRLGQDDHGPGARLQNLMETEDQGSEL
jgi:hypothetical protein